jgi:hypothetical protein
VQEKLLQFIWQHSLYQPNGLTTSQGEVVTVIHPGRYNTNAGPDFLEGKVRIGDTTLVGHIELHINTSDWHKHGHQNDKAYQNIILHVVFNNDAPAVADSIPVLELSQHIPAALLDKYASLLQSRNTILCHTQLGSVRDITKEAWLSRLLAERWEEKLVDWKELLDGSAGDWRNLLYWRMAYNFGFKVNATPFLMLARSIPLNVLAKHRENLLQVEALLFGQAGMLQGHFKDEYPALLQKEYAYLANKYQLQSIEAHLWKFLRMRPANFPTIRIAQFAALVHKSLHLFSQIIEVHSVKEITPLLEVKASDYWRQHYRFDDEGLSRGTDKQLGKSSIQNIIINTVAPIQFLYAGRQGVDGKQEKALQLLDEISAEQNHILEQWDGVGWKVQNAAQSQALLQLYNNYCTRKRCLECSIGHSIMRLGPDK